MVRSRLWKSTNLWLVSLSKQWKKQSDHQYYHSIELPLAFHKHHQGIRALRGLQDIATSVPFNRWVDVLNANTGIEYKPYQ
jgi:hypothetical protein